MKTIKLLLSLLLISVLLTSYSQTCSGGFTTGRGNLCDLTITDTLKANHITEGTWKATPVSISYGGTGQTTATGAINALLPSQSGNANKVLSTNATNVSWISIKTPVIFTGTTNASGNYTVTYSSAYASTPHVNPVLVGGTNTQVIKLVSSTTTGFTVNVTNRVDVIGLLPSYTNVSGASISVLIVEQ